MQTFFYRRIRTKADAADLAQEVYVRMLGVSDADAIRSPERYLFTVASNLVKEHAVLDRRNEASVDVDEPSVHPQLAEPPCFDVEVDAADRVQRLRAVLRQLPPKCRAVIVLQYRHGLSYQEIADRIGVSTHMVKKYHVQALAHCRRHMVSLD